MDDPLRLLTPEQVARQTPAERMAWLHIAATGLRAIKTDDIPLGAAKITIAIFDALTSDQQLRATSLTVWRGMPLLDAIIAVIDQ